MDNKAYDDFEPFCKWHTDTFHDILQIYLQGFHKDQIKIEINTKNEIIISGERPADGSPNKMRRFRKEIKVSPREHNIDEIDANYESGCLSIVMPRKVRSNSLFADQIIKLKHLLRSSTLPKNGSSVQVIVAISLGMVLGVYMAYKYSKRSSEPQPKN